MEWCQLGGPLLCACSGWWGFLKHFCYLWTYVFAKNSVVVGTFLYVKFSVLCGHNAVCPIRLRDKINWLWFGKDHALASGWESGSLTIFTDFTGHLTTPILPQFTTMCMTYVCITHGMKLWYNLTQYGCRHNQETQLTAQSPHIPRKLLTTADGAISFEILLKCNFTSLSG